MFIYQSFKATQVDGLKSKLQSIKSGAEINSPQGLGGIVMVRGQETSCRYGLISDRARCWLPFISLSLSSPCNISSDYQHYSKSASDSH